MVAVARAARRRRCGHDAGGGNENNQKEEASPQKRTPFQIGKVPALTLAALGVVFGDIATSPLYTFSGTSTVARRRMIDDDLPPRMMIDASRLLFTSARMPLCYILVLPTRYFVGRRIIN